MLASRVRMAKQIGGLPGSDKLIGGNENAGFYGEVEEVSFITMDNFINYSGVEGLRINKDNKWLKFIYQGKTLYRPMKAILSGMGARGIKNANCYDGSREIEIRNTFYSIRVMEGATADGSNFNIKMQSSEWNRLILPITSKANSQNWYNKNSVDIPTENWNINYSEEDLGVGDNSDGKMQIVDSTAGNTFQKGNGTFTDYRTYADSNTSDQIGWVPVLEVIK